MTLRYHTRQGKQIPTYVCQRDGIEKSEPICQTIPGRTLDAALGDLMLELMTPLTLDIALAVQEELEHRIEEVQELRQQHVKRAQFEVDLARRRYMEIDPGNRLVADSLEAEWNEKLRILAETRDEQERQSEQDRVHLDDEVRRKVHALTTDFPRVWRDPQTSDHDRKRMLRLLVSDVTLIKGEQIQAQVRLKGGAIRTLMVEKSLPAHEARKTDPEVVQEVDRLLDTLTAGQIAARLNDLGYESGTKKPLTAKIVARICRDYHVNSRHDRLREAGKLTVRELAERLDVSVSTVNIWRRHGLLQGHLYNDKNEHLYDPPDAESPNKMQGQKLSERRRCPEVVSQSHNEV